MRYNVDVGFLKGNIVTVEILLIGLPGILYLGYNMLKTVYMLMFSLTKADFNKEEFIEYLYGAFTWTLLTSMLVYMLISSMGQVEKCDFG